MNTLPLKDYRILITRGKEQAERFKTMIEQYGGTPIIVPLLDFQLPANLEAIEATITNMTSYDWLILTSQNGVQFLFELMEKYGVSASLPKLAVIGTKTQEELERYGHMADFVPNQFVAEAFIDQFLPLLHTDSRVLLAKGNLARNVIAGGINKAGASCDEVIVYETVLPKESIPRLVHILREREANVVTFTSSSTIHHFMRIVEQYGLHPYLESLIIACIGPIAKKTAEHYRLKVDLCPDTYTTEAMLQELLTYTKNKGGTPL